MAHRPSGSFPPLPLVALRHYALGLWWYTLLCRRVPSEGWRRLRVAARRCRSPPAALPVSYGAAAGNICGSLLGTALVPTSCLQLFLLQHSSRHVSGAPCSSSLRRIMLGGWGLYASVADGGLLTCLTSRLCCPAAWVATAPQFWLPARLSSSEYCGTAPQRLSFVVAPFVC